MKWVKRISLLVILSLGVWALLPPRAEEAGGADAETPEDGAAGSAERPYHLRVAPGGWYMPGMIPGNIGKPLEGFAKVARAFEALYPDTSIECVNVPSVREWLVTRLVSEQAPDILQVNVEDVWQDVQKGWYVPLDSYLEQPNPFVKPGAPGSRQWWDLFKYQAISRGKSAPDGKMYCISLDMVETGIFYNKDIFAKIGAAEPKDWNEFLDIHTKLQEAGYIPILLVLQRLAGWGVDLMFDQMYYDLLPGIDLIQDPIREQYLAGYLDWDEIYFLHGKGFFTPKDVRYREVWRLLKEWRLHANKDMVSVDLMREFITQRAAMLWDASWSVHKLTSDPDIEFDWGVFYPPPLTLEQSPYAGCHEMCVIGGSGNQYVVSNSAVKDTKDAATSERLKRCIAFLQFLTTPENTAAVVGEVSSFLPNVVGVEPHPGLLPFHEILQRRYTTTKWNATFDLRFNEIAKRMSGLYLDDGITLDAFLEWMDENIASAGSTAARRKNLDFTEYERRWQAGPGA